MRRTKTQTTLGSRDTSPHYAREQRGKKRGEGGRRRERGKGREQGVERRRKEKRTARGKGRREG